MHERAQLFLEFRSALELDQEIARDLRKGRAFVTGEFGLTERELCELVLIHPTTGEWLPLKAEAVHLAFGPQAGVGLQILEPVEHLAELLSAFVADTEPPSVEPLSIDLTSPELGSTADEDEAAGPAPSSSQLGLPAAARVRGLNAAGRDRVARHGSLAERVALERAFGPAVWEALLANPLLSTAEVSRIAKNHTASQPILNLIAQNPAWLVKPEVRRALLSNPRLPEPQVERTLRALPATELKLVLKQTAYPARVRNVAKRLLGL